jgi:hypothetical protein
LILDVICTCEKTGKRHELPMKSTCTKTCVHLSCVLVCLLLLGLCPGWASCSDPESQADLGHASGQECAGHTSFSQESVRSFECPATEHSRNECCRSCSDSPFHLGCDWESVLPNRTNSITVAAFAWTGSITNNAGLGQDGLPSQSSGIANAALPLLRTVILLT